MDNKEISTQSRDKYNKKSRIPQKNNKRDLRQRLRKKQIKSHANHSMVGISPKSKMMLKVSKTLAIPQKRTKKKGLHVQSISFSKSGFFLIN
jgi:hypothetical protein